MRISVMAVMRWWASLEQKNSRLAPCKVECPAHIDVQGYVNLAPRGNFKEALQLIKLASPFPSICGRVCHHPCESDCNRDQIDESVGIHSIERFLADLDLKADKRYMPEIKGRKRRKLPLLDRVLPA